MATAYILKKGKGWFLGFPEGTVPGADTNGTQSAEVGSAVDSAHTKDSGGNDAMSVYYNRQSTLSVSAVSADGSVPEAGQEMSYAGKQFVITSASVAYNNGATGAIVNITAESRDAWGS